MRALNNWREDAKQGARVQHASCSCINRPRNDYRSVEVLKCHIMCCRLPSDCFELKCKSSHCRSVECPIVLWLILSGVGREGPATVSPLIHTPAWMPTSC